MAVCLQPKQNQQLVLQIINCKHIMHCICMDFTSLGLRGFRKKKKKEQGGLHEEHPHLSYVGHVLRWIYLESHLPALKLQC